jgi:hypothetical protein
MTLLKRAILFLVLHYRMLTSFGEPPVNNMGVGRVYTGIYLLYLKMP